MRLRIVVAAAESQTRDHLFDLLHALGHDVATVGHARALLELCRSFEPDLVVADVEMGEAARGAPSPSSWSGAGSGGTRWKPPWPWPRPQGRRPGR